MATNFLTTINAEQIDLGIQLQDQTSHTIIIPTTQYTNQEYSMTFKKKVAIRTNDIKVGMNGYCLNGSQVYTFGPAQQGLWIAGGNGTNTLAFSNNGINWYGLGVSSSTIFGESGTINGFAYNGKIWVAVGSGTGTVAYSFDGKIWFEKTVFSNVGYVVVWNRTMFVAGGQGSTAAFAYSYDGINWIANGYPDITIRSLAWNGSLWLAGEEAEYSFIYYSYDGISWFPTEKNFSTHILSIAWNGSFWIANGATSSAYSFDGREWHNGNSQNNIISSYVTFSIWDGSKWITGGSGSDNSIAYTFDPTGNTGWISTLSGGASNIMNNMYWNGKLFVGGGLSNTTVYSLNGLNWSSTSTTITNARAFLYNNITPHSITFPRYTIISGSNGITDIDGYTSVIQYSYDGINWGTVLDVNSNFFNSVIKIAYNGIIWLAGGTGYNTIAYSYDGLSWNGLGTYIFTSSCISFAWNETIWVATGVSSGTGWNIAYSYDGLTWVGALKNNVFFRNETNNEGARGVAWNGRMFVCVGRGTTSSNCIIYSYNGINWFSTGQTIFTTTGNDVIWNGSLWIAVGEGTNSIAYSYNGLNWTGLGNSITSQAINIGWNDKMAILTHANGIAYSFNGINWVSNTSIFSNGSGSGIAWDGTRWQLGSSTSSSAYSYNGFDWTTYTANYGSIQTNSFASTFKTTPTVYIQHPSVAVGVGKNTIAYSEDGITWTGLGSNIFSIEGRFVLWNGQIWVAVGSGSNTIAYSKDGINWIGLGSNIFSVSGNNLAWNGNMWIATGNDLYNTIAYSLDGINWIGLGNSIFSIQGFGVAWNGYAFVALGEGTNTIAYSFNGINWKGIGKPIFNNRGYSIATNGMYWIATGSGNSTLAYTTDLSGASGWTSVPEIFDNEGRDICWNGSTWVAVGKGNNSIAYSTNGTTWYGANFSTNIFTTAGFGCCWNGVRFIGVGEGTNSIAYSKDGINWFPAYSGYSNLSNLQIFSLRGYNVSSNPRVGVPIVNSQIILNPNGPSGTSSLQINAPSYYQKGFNEVSITVEQNNVY